MQAEVPVQPRGHACLNRYVVSVGGESGPSTAEAVAEFLVTVVEELDPSVPEKADPCKDKNKASVGIDVSKWQGKIDWDKVKKTASLT